MVDVADDRPFLSAGGGNGQQQINETEWKSSHLLLAS